MNMLDTDLDESDLFCKSNVLKRKAVENDNPKTSKQLKLKFNQTSNSRNEEEKKDENNLTSEKIKINKNHTSLSQSAYFRVKKSVNTCPLCLKSFQSDSSYSSHMKQCAKTHKMTTQQLLDALELQKKQMQERRDLVLHSQGALSEKKGPPKKKTDKYRDSYDLALGLALSKSLTTAESRIVTLPEAPKSTLKEFGFTSSSTAVGVVGPNKRKNEWGKKLLLKERTAEERQRIIIEKVAVVLLDEDKEEAAKCNKANPSFDFQDVQVTKLWSKGESNSKSGWHVPGIKGLEFSDEGSKVEVTESVSDNFEKEIVKLNLPQKDISSDWRKIINSEKLSDLVGKTRDGQDVFVHSIVLYVRCPGLLEKDFASAFEKFNSSTVLIFLEYLYCGTLNGLCKAEVDDLYKLAKEFDYSELIQVVHCLKNNLSAGVSPRASNFSKESKHMEKEVTAIEDKKPEIVEVNDEKDFVHLTQDEHVPEGECEDSSNAEKSFWSFIQLQKKVEKLEDVESLETKKENLVNSQLEDEETNLKSPLVSDKVTEQRRISGDSTTKDWNDILNERKATTFSDCVILSSGSETRSEEKFIKYKTSPSGTPSPVDVNYDVPLFDPYENFHCFSEEPFSPVGLHSQSLIMGDISLVSPKENDGTSGQEEPKKIVGYCSTPVTARHPSEIIKRDYQKLFLQVYLSAKNFQQRNRKKRCDLSSSRLLRKSLGLDRKKNQKRDSFKKKRNDKKKGLEEALTNSVLKELSKCSASEPPPLQTRNFVEITPISSKEFADTVTPSPNFSDIEEAMLKEQLSKYGLKKNLAKSKAKKILRLIYEELHPLYNTETGKIVKILPGNTLKSEKKSKPAGKSKKEKNSKTKQSKNDGSGKKISKRLNSSKESENLSDGSLLSHDRSFDRSSGESDFESLNETLTQSVPTSPVNLPSAFSEFLQNNPEYHQKILLYEPIWLEELQKKLKECFKKHFRMSDIMTFLDQKCIAFRSAAQAKKLQKRFQRKEKSRSKKNLSKENCS